MNTLAAYWVTIACLLVFCAVTFAVVSDQGKLRRRQDELTARVDRIAPPTERGRGAHRYVPPTKAELVAGSTVVDR